MPTDRPYRSLRLYLLRLSFLSAILLSFYLLFISRSEEVYTVWGVMHTLFIPAFTFSTFILLVIVFSSETVGVKLLFVILHSVLSHSLMVTVFPAGNVGIQQGILGKTRLVFDNVIPNGFGGSIESVPLKMYVLLRGENLQTAFSVIFARMFGVDVFWTHLLLVPTLWGMFVPMTAFMISKKLGASENIAVLSGLAVSLFPTTILWGVASIPNGLSYLFFFCFIYSLLRYLSSNGRKNLFLIATFFLATFLSHYLAGTVAFSLLLLACTLKIHENEKVKSHSGTKLMLLLSFVFCVSILPFALAYRRLFYPWANTRFSLEKFSELSPPATLFSILFGSYFDFISREAYITTLIFGLALLLGLIGMIYILLVSVRKRPKRSVDLLVLFLFLGLLLVVVDDRTVKLFMTNVPFVEVDRLWVFRDFLLVPFLALVIGGAVREMQVFFDRASKSFFSFLPKKFSESAFSKAFSFFMQGHLVRGVSLGSILAYVLVLTLVSGWVTASIYYSYPQWAPLQTTSYELEAVKYIDETTNERYIVVCDQWIIFAGQMFVGINNPRAFYFSYVDPRGVSLFVKMKTNPTNETLTEATKFNNATVAYFIIEKPRVGIETYNDIINQARQNSLQTYKILYYPEGEEKLRIFYYKRQWAED